MCVMAVCLLLFGTAAARPGSPAPSTEPESEPITELETIEDIDLSSGHFAPAPPMLAPLATSGVITAGDCRYRQAVDEAHVTRGQASVHGYWIQVGGTCPSTATSMVWIQAWWCDGYGCRWITLESGTRSAAPGTGKRANARWTCAPTNRLVGWRGIVDVDLDWHIDPSGLTIGDYRNLRCAPW